jgi:hypothetical protein
MGGREERGASSSSMAHGAASSLACLRSSRANPSADPDGLPAFRTSLLCGRSLKILVRLPKRTPRADPKHSKFKSFAFSGATNRGAYPLWVGPSSRPYALALPWAVSLKTHKKVSYNSTQSSERERSPGPRLRVIPLGFGSPGCGAPPDAVGDGLRLVRSTRGDRLNDTLDLDSLC